MQIFKMNKTKIFHLK